jgi:hypothetical protein
MTVTLSIVPAPLDQLGRLLVFIELEGKGINKCFNIFGTKFQIPLQASSSYLREHSFCLQEVSNLVGNCFLLQCIMTRETDIQAF